MNDVSEWLRFPTCVLRDGGRGLKVEADHYGHGDPCAVIVQEDSSRISVHGERRRTIVLTTQEVEWLLEDGVLPAALRCMKSQ